ncbi:MAG: winged helix-turn-helix domain-containing protein [Fervidicoccaceae archaeon]
MARDERKYRTDTEIIYEMMSVIVSGGEQGIKKTHLMYKTNLNSKMLQKYLDILEKGGLITEITLGKQKLVKLTSAGVMAFSALQTLSTLLNIPAGIGSATNQKSKYLDELSKTGFPVSTGKTILGRTGMQYQPDAIIEIKGESYPVKMIVGKKEFEGNIEFLNFILMLVDGEKKGILITDNANLEKSIPKKLADDIKFIHVISPEKVAEKVKAAFQA